MTALPSDLAPGQTVTVNAQVKAPALSGKGNAAAEVKANGNTVDFTYFRDGLLETQTEKKPDGTLVSDHVVAYDLNGNRWHDVSRKMNADNDGAYLTTTTARRAR